MQQLQFLLVVDSIDMSMQDDLRLNRFSTDISSAVSAERQQKQLSAYKNSQSRYVPVQMDTCRCN